MNLLLTDPLYNQTLHIATSYFIFDGREDQSRARFSSHTQVRKKSRNPNRAPLLILGEGGGLDEITVEGTAFAHVREVLTGQMIDPFVPSHEAGPVNPFRHRNTR